MQRTTPIHHVWARLQTFARLFDLDAKTNVMTLSCVILTYRHATKPLPAFAAGALRFGTMFAKAASAFAGTTDDVRRYRQSDEEELARAKTLAEQVLEGQSSLTRPILQPRVRRAAHKDYGTHG